MDTLIGTDGLIDVQKLISRYSIADHIAQADAYFAKIPEKSFLLRKPFADAAEAAEITQGLSLILKGMKLVPGARVVDFGAGTAWLSKIFAYLGCEAIAVDLSRTALDRGRRLIEADPLAADLAVSFLPFDGVRIDLPDGDVDRLCCFDSFHHVADQAAMLAEFARILKPGGIAAFHEPGPDHSRTPDAQAEMANFEVIENDIVIEEIERAAAAVGLTDLKLAYYMPEPLFLGLEQFNCFRQALVVPDQAMQLIAESGAPLRGKRIFFLRKTGEEVQDSRSRAALAGTLAIALERQEGGRFVGTATLRNTGAALWLPSGGGLGAVNLGVHLLDADGTMRDQDYARCPVVLQPLAPGETRTVPISLPVPDLPDYKLAFDLVAELITWFAGAGGKMVTLAAGELPSL